MFYFFNNYLLNMKRSIQWFCFRVVAQIQSSVRLNTQTKNTRNQVTNTKPYFWIKGAVQENDQKLTPLYEDIYKSNLLYG